MTLRFALTGLALAVISGATFGQVVYEPVRYQYGRYNEVYYGGANPGLTNNGYVYLPPALQTAYTAQRLNTPPWVNGYTPYGAGSPFFSPYNTDGTNSSAVYTPYVFSDYVPYLEVGQFGFTPNDARNEAYARYPLYQGPIVPAQGPATTAPAEQSSSGVTSAQTIPAKDKAIPLLNWAKVERERNPVLFKALTDEARKYDADATEALMRSVASEK